MNSTKRLHTLLTCAAVALAAAGCASTIDDAEPAESTAEALSAGCSLEIPDALAAPQGNTFAFSYHAEGVQIYACTADATGASWVFQAPQADLFGKHHHFAGTHYAGPTWESKDGSSFVASKVAGATVDATAIPWLLLQAVSHDGGGHMAKVTYVQRLETVGGLAPAGGCDVSHVGAIANVDYTATYAFYEAKKSPKP